MQTSINQIQIHYALQTCDVKSYQGQKRYASDDRTLISKKCIKSFLESVSECSLNKPEIQHTIAPIDPRIMRPYKKVSRKNAVLVEEDVPWQIVACELFAPAQFNISLNAPPPTAQ